ncbi:MAG: hypothetical protein COV47_02355 [Candidatus Diapherotrites archaeon CG11_big_fil_rev_8_21_14_0_20_37_9]|nr:MAG: hypothetical protein COV47_02355 [Candidatus Diapherotrites archaeon CG11_big_fil_rev_8_21_14_0_20_37_9]
MKSTPEFWDRMYEMPLDEIPWEINDAPMQLKNLVEKRKINGMCLDIGCGSGNYSIYLAKNGFDVTGIDYSKKAISIAKKKAKEAKVKINFFNGNIQEFSKKTKKQFSFILDYCILHHVPNEELGKHAKCSAELLEQGGKILLACFSEKDNLKRKADGVFGNKMNFRTREEIKKIYSKNGFTEKEYSECLLGKIKHHKGHCFLFEKK